MAMNMNRGTFLTTTKPAILWLGKDDFAYLQEQRYQCANGDLVRIPLIVRDGHVYGFRLDFGSKPSITVSLVGDRVDEGTPGYGGHDWLYVAQYVERDGERIRITRERADEILLEMLLTLGMDPLKAQIIYDAVRVGGQSQWEQHDGNTADHFVRLHVLAAPSFNPEADELMLHRIGIQEKTPCPTP